ncbi:metal-dependent hydrolase [Desertibacillus haloalkaliphilus]|uniref:metal-dependent hydrolase n=1 Tax=Desertibacillus haloalkaliphilus TaxID=1328930 RepID=UPI001C270612|nr:metal-dependent hydrolase [Desertibacillus haloalkaliphilus]MBU8906116.1 metal-dependent hydrolase [Desertibacillus haloalkaliphilus]
MKGSTHLLGGLAAAVATYHTIHIDSPTIFYVSAIIGSMIPDICHPNSMIGRRLKVISKPLNKAFGHRTITHSLLFLLAIYWITSQLPTSYSSEIQVGLTAGMISHFILDAMTARGIQLFYPIKAMIRLPFYTKTGSAIGEGFVSIGLLVVIIYNLI